jgi:CHAT domain-containing protein
LEAVPENWISAPAHIVVIADGPLLYLPFEFLPHAGKRLADLSFVSYAPSVTVLGELTRRASGPPQERPARPFLGIGLTESGGRSGPAPLPGAREVREIAADYGPGARTLTGAEASKDAILAQSAEYRVVHFATHGVIDDAEPMYSGLRVAADQPGDAEGAENGRHVLHTYEMFGLALSGAVVVCSACETGGGHVRAGEGLMGMSRALFYAGAIALVVALWPVPDVPTRRLMRVFHRYLRDGRPPAEALSLAKRAVRASHPHVYRHPYTWAGFIVVGTA